MPAASAPAPSLIAPPHVAARREREIHPLIRRILLAALGGFAAIFLDVPAKRSAAFDLAITLKMQQDRSPVLARSCDRRPGRASRPRAGSSRQS